LFVAYRPGRFNRMILCLSSRLSLIINRQTGSCPNLSFSIKLISICKYIGNKFYILSMLRRGRLIFAGSLSIFL